jgi:hypothetical protein
MRSYSTLWLWLWLELYALRARRRRAAEPAPDRPHLWKTTYPPRRLHAAACWCWKRA